MSDPTEEPRTCTVCNEPATDAMSFLDGGIEARCDKHMDSWFGVPMPVGDESPKEWRCMYRTPTEDWRFSYPVTEAVARDEAAFHARLGWESYAVRMSVLADERASGSERNGLEQDEYGEWHDTVLESDYRSSQANAARLLNERNASASRLAELEAAAAEFLRVWDEAAPFLRAVTMSAYAHGVKYTGPNAGPAIESLRAALAMQPVSPSDGGEVVPQPHPAREIDRG